MTPSDLSIRRFLDGVRFTGAFLRGESAVQAALRSLVQRLEGAGIAYAIVGAMALNEHGYRRVTGEVDVLLDASGLSRDLADVLEVIRTLRLEEGVAERLAPSVRAKYRELWQAARRARDLE
jgi:hypothetical protein